MTHATIPARPDDGTRSWSMSQLLARATGKCQDCGTELTEVETGDEEWIGVCPTCVLERNDD